MEGLENVNSSTLRDVVIAIVAVGTLVIYIGARISKFKVWVKGEIMNDVDFLDRLEERFAKRAADIVRHEISIAFTSHEERENTRYRSIEDNQRRIELKIVQLGSNLQIVESKVDSAPSELDMDTPDPVITRRK